MTITERQPVSRLSQEEFDAIVNADVRGTRGGLDHETAAMLRDPENVERWYESLLVMKRHVEAQLTTKRAELAQTYVNYMILGIYEDPSTDWQDESKVAWLTFDNLAEREKAWLKRRAEVVKWRQGAVRFRNGLEDRLAEARSLREKVRANAEIDLVYSERNAALREVIRLRSGIISHRDAVVEDPENSETADESLWQLADNVIQ